MYCIVLIRANIVESTNPIVQVVIKAYTKYLIFLNGLN